MTHSAINVPNAVSLTRILLSPFLFYAGWTLDQTMFLWIFSASLITDALDGFLARMLHQQTKLGSQLDSIGDILTGVAVLFVGTYLWPELLTNEWVWICVSVISLSIAGGVSLMKYHHLPSYHTWSAKLATVVLGIGLWLYFINLTSWGVRLGAVIVCLAALEEAAITLILPEWQPNVPHIFHALKIRKRSQDPSA